MYLSSTTESVACCVDNKRSHGTTKECRRASHRITFAICSHERPTDPKIRRKKIIKLYDEVASVAVVLLKSIWIHDVSKWEMLMRVRLVYDDDERNHRRGRKSTAASSIQQKTEWKNETINSRHERNTHKSTLRVYCGAFNDSGKEPTFSSLLDVFVSLFWFLFSFNILILNRIRMEKRENKHYRLCLVSFTTALAMACVSHSVA